VKEVTIKTTAARQVIFPIKEAGPLAPKTEEEDPPKAAPRPELFPAWSKTLTMRTMAIKMWTTVTAVCIF
jgi:hypothetical protein